VRAMCCGACGEIGRRVCILSAGDTKRGRKERLVILQLVGTKSIYVLARPSPRRKRGSACAYDTFDSNATTRDKVLGENPVPTVDGPSPPSLFSRTPVKAQGCCVFEASTKPSSPNIDNVWPEMPARLASYDPGINRRHHMWGPHGHRASMSSAHANSALDPTARSKLGTSCSNREFRRLRDLRREMLDSSRRTSCRQHLPILPFNPECDHPTELGGRQRICLIKSRPFVRRFFRPNISTRSRPVNLFVVGCVGPDIQSRRKGAARGKRERERRPTLGYVIQWKARKMWFDKLAIPERRNYVARAHEPHSNLFAQSRRLLARNSNVVACRNGTAAKRPKMDRKLDHEDHGGIPIDEGPWRASIRSTPRSKRTQRLMPGCGPGSRPAL